MGYRALQACLRDLEASSQLLRIDDDIDPYLEAACLVRLVYQAGGPAVYFPRVKGCRFPMVGNLFGTLERSRYIFRDTLDAVSRLVQLKVNPADVLRRPWRFLGAPRVAWNLLPRFVSNAPVLSEPARVSDLPRLVCWPRDGGPFVTLPQVYTEDPAAPGPWKSNLGMYRIQLSGNQYGPDQEVGMHYQIHRGIGIHHAAAIARGERLQVAIHVGGPPALAIAAVMPLPEGMPEIAFAGALSGHQTRVFRRAGQVSILADADFVILGTIEPDRLLPEGPFGDHLGYYSLAHDFPVLRVDGVFHRPGAVWPFTSVGRPPQEDTTFGRLIHDITGPLIPSVLPGVRAVHAVDAAGVHPLLLAVGSERYTPYEPRREPRELLTQANAILGQGQLSLAKYLMIVAHEDARGLDVYDVAAFLAHLLARIDWRRDLHFQTRTTIDTLDYSGEGLNRGSKVVMAAVGEPIRTLSQTAPASLPAGLRAARVVAPGILAVESEGADLEALRGVTDEGLPLWVVVDDSAFVSKTLANFLWVTFTRSNPAVDVHGFDASTRHKHWGCAGPLVIDARTRPHHAPPLEEDPGVLRRMEALLHRHWQK